MTKKVQMYVKNKSISMEDGELVRDDSGLFYYPFKEGVGYNFKYRSAFTKSYQSVSLPSGVGGFSDLELGRIYRISRLMYSDSNLLARRTNNHLEPFTRDEIQNMLKMHRTKFVPFWKKLLDFRILKPIPYDGNTYFCMNPLYYNSTTYIPVHVYLAFQNDIGEHIPDWAIKKYLEMETEANKSEESEEKEST